MTADISHRAFFGTGEHDFCLTDAMVHELEKLTQTGIGIIYLRAVASQFSLYELGEIIRLGLIGGGMNPEAAKRLTDAYAVNRPIGETYPLALDILDARYSGKPDLEAAA